jgi:hypothetical protein
MRKHLSPGVVLGVIARVLVMTGSAIAASKITGAQIKDGTITGKDVKNRSLDIDTTTPTDPSVGACGSPAMAISSSGLRQRRTVPAFSSLSPASHPKGQTNCLREGTPLTIVPASAR